MADDSWPTHAVPRITDLTFADVLTGTAGREFDGMPEVGDIWTILGQYGVDPSFALAHFWVESLFGTAGWNVWSDPPLRSWANLLWENSHLRGTAGVGKYVATNGFNYTYYPDWTTGILDYCLHLKAFVDNSPDSRYGDTSIIYGATAKWPAKPPGSPHHLTYLDVVLSRMNRYDTRPPFEGDAMITTPGVTYGTNMRYRVKAGERWYPKAGGTTSYSFRADSTALYFGTVLGTNWGAIRVITGRFTNDGKTRPVIGYLKTIDPARVTVI